MISQRALAISRVYRITDQKKEAIFCKALCERDRVIYKIACETALRISDVLTLKRKDVLADGKFTIREQKTGKVQRLQLSEPLKEEIKQYIAHNKTLLYRRRYIFVSPYRKKSKKGGRDSLVTRQTIWRNYKKAARIAKIKRNTGTHSGRKQFTHAYYTAHGLAALQKRLKHSNGKITAVYR